MSLKKTLSSSSGFALVSAVFITALISSLIVSLFSVYLSKYKLSQSYHSQLKAFYASVAGINIASYYLRQNPNWQPESEFFPISSQKTFYQTQIKIKKQLGSILIRAKGRYQNFEEILERELALPISPFFSTAIVTTQKLKKKDIRGYVKGEIKTRTSLPYFNPHSFKETFEEYLKWLTNPYLFEQVEGCVWSYENRPDFSRRPRIYVMGNLTFEGGSLEEPLLFKGPATIVCSGSITLSEGVRLVKINLIAQGDIKLHHHSFFLRGNLFSLLGGIEMADQTVFQGKMMATSTILIKDQAFIFPYSVIYLRGRKHKDTLKGQVKIEREAFVQATVIAYQKRQNLSVLLENTFYRGLIYTNLMELKNSEVYGTVVAEKFKKIEGVIDRTKLDDRFLIPACFSSQGKYLIGVRMDETKMF
jgi:hypothetical protein